MLTGIKIVATEGHGKTLKSAPWKFLPEDCFVEKFTFAKDSPYKAFETANHGWLIFGQDARLKDGSIPEKKIFKY